MDRVSNGSDEAATAMSRHLDAVEDRLGVNKYKAADEATKASDEAFDQLDASQASNSREVTFSGVGQRPLIKAPLAGDFEVVPDFVPQSPEVEQHEAAVEAAASETKSPEAV